MIARLGYMKGNAARYQTLWTGIANWKAVWNRYTFHRVDRSFDVLITPDQNDDQPDTEKVWLRPGFWRHASEYWLLSKIFLERMIVLQSEQNVDDVRTTSIPFEDNHDSVDQSHEDEYDENYVGLNSIISKFHALKSH